ncbi:eukaryotic translation initiation factor 3 subunit F-like isoform X2 [Hydractinia symbiolongicarpus]|nr:eukaryotic translation initiation factor 3 subunit F-like isoform X2 [Hydractinia symbiolongicarpus]XP_057301739.1 eukaryotic translation initiation factor 3 subunit F-like isoform X2 [Hydractinia symbiolongicarpus]
MLELYKYASPAEDIVGWFATSHDVTGHSTLIHDYYSIECANPIHFTLDTQLKTGHMTTKAYVSSLMGVPGGTRGSIFTPVPCEIKSYEPEAIAIQTFARNKGGSKKPTSLLSGVQHVSRSANDLVDRLKNVLQYVKDVINDTTPANNEVGQKLMAMLGQVPQMDSKQIEKMMNNNMQDLLMVLYLASLTKTQLSVGTKINSII